MKHEENDWGITLEGGEESQEAPKQEETFVEVKKEQSLADLIASMKSLQTK